MSHDVRMMLSTDTSDRTAEARRYVLATMSMQSPICVHVQIVADCGWRLVDRPSRPIKRRRARDVVVMWHRVHAHLSLSLLAVPPGDLSLRYCVAYEICVARTTVCGFKQNYFQK